MSYIEELMHKTPEWHERRRKVIGGSDAVVIMSGNEEAIYRLWQEKRGEAKPEDLSDKLPVLMGTLTEQLNVAWFERKTGLTVTLQNEFLTSGIMGATLDGYIASENAIVECKHVGGFVPFEETVAHYMPQLQHIMSVKGAKAAYLSVFIGSATWRCERIEYDPFYCEQLFEAEAAFWSAVQTGVPPVPVPPVQVPPGEANRIVDMSRNNSWAVNVKDYLLNKDGAEKFDGAKTNLKNLVESDVRTAHGIGIIINRDRKGALRFKDGSYEQQRKDGPDRGRAGKGSK